MKFKRLTYALAALASVLAFAAPVSAGGTQHQDTHKKPHGNHCNQYDVEKPEVQKDTEETQSHSLDKKGHHTFYKIDSKKNCEEDTTPPPVPTPEPTPTPAPEPTPQPDSVPTPPQPTLVESAPVEVPVVYPSICLKSC